MRSDPSRRTSCWAIPVRGRPPPSSTNAKNWATPQSSSMRASSSRSIPSSTLSGEVRRSLSMASTRFGQVHRTRARRSNRIRSRLDSLGRPPFRISCREADWLGENDRARLGTVAPEATVTTLRASTLSHPWTSSRSSAPTPESPARKPSSRGPVSAVSKRCSLTRRPSTCWPTWLAHRGTGRRAVSRRLKWPAARWPVSTTTRHALASARPPLEGLLDAAGYLCAAQLVTGAAGYSRRNGGAGPDLIALSDCDYPDSSVLDHALETKLFGAVDGERLAPVHRHTAEFLAARYLRKRISEGLSARRVLALISGADGSIVTEMRGLSGWLAAHCSDARDLLIVKDPLGAALYGDLRDFSTDARRTLLEALSPK